MSTTNTHELSSLMLVSELKSSHSCSLFSFVADVDLRGRNVLLLTMCVCGLVRQMFSSLLGRNNKLGENI